MSITSPQTPMETSARRLEEDVVRELDFRGGAVNLTDLMMACMMLAARSPMMLFLGKK